MIISLYIEKTFDKIQFSFMITVVVVGGSCLSPGTVVHVCNPSSWEVETGRLGVQDLTKIHSKLKNCLTYMRL